MASRDPQKDAAQNQNQRGRAARVQTLVPKPQAAASKYEARKARPALDNISNLVPAVHNLEGKPINRPITRGFGAKLLASAQTATTVPGSKKSVADMTKEVKKINLEPATKKAACAAKPILKQKQVGDDAVQKQRVDQRPIARKNNVPKVPSQKQLQEGKKVTQNNGRSDPSVAKVTVTVPVKPIINKPEYSRRREVHTLTSVLSARSKFACGIKERAPKEAQIENIDAADANDQLAVVEYIEDLYKYYKQVEDTFRPHDYVIRQSETNPRRRAILLDWIIEVHNRFKLRPETLYLTAYIVDRYLSVEEVLVPRTKLQLVGLSAMLIASKYEEIWAPQVGDLIAISDYIYGREDILAKEKQILNKLDWYLTVPTLYMFLVRFIKAARGDKQMENMVYYIAELGLLEYSLMIKFSPSMVAASCVYVARCTLKKSPLWTPTLVHHTHYAAHQLCECAQILVTAQSGVPQSKLRAIHNKYSREEFGKVALYQAEVSPSSSSTAYASCCSSTCSNSN